MSRTLTITVSYREGGRFYTKSRTHRFSVKLTLNRELRRFRSVLDAASCQADVEWRLRYGAAAGREDRFNRRARRDI